MEELIELLEEIQPDADFENCDTLIDDGILDSFAILSIVSELQDTYDITITPADIIPENFLFDGIKANYPKKDYHRMYIGEITSCFDNFK